MLVNRPYDLNDLEDILYQIRSSLVKYKKEKYDMTEQVLQDLIDDACILRVQLSDLGADLAMDKLEATAKFDHDKAQLEEDEEIRIRALPKGKNTNASDRAKRRAKLDVSPADMHRAYKMDKLAYNLYAVSLEQWIFAMYSRLSSIKKPSQNTAATTRSMGFEGPDAFDEMKETIAAERDLNGLEKIVHGEE